MKSFKICKTDCMDDCAECERQKFQDPMVMEAYDRLKKREFIWNDEVDEDIIDLSLYIQKWNAEDKGVPVEKRIPIKVFINTDGGDLNAVMNAVDMILLSKTPVITIGLGKIYSAGLLLFIAGAKRYVFRHTSCLIHDGFGGIMDSTAKMIDALKFTECTEAQIQDYIMDRTSISKAVLKKNYRKDWFILSDEMVKLGIADEIITDIDVIL